MFSSFKKIETLFVMIEELKTNYHPPFLYHNFYHIYNKAVGSDLLFYTDENYKYFLKKFSFFMNNFVNTYAFCLLPNHFHFLISPIVNDPEIISRQFKRLFISYSMALNKQRGRRGNLFQKNFKRKVVCGEDHLKKVVHYIHVNPLHHSVFIDFKNYAYSSYKIIIGTGFTNLKRTDVINWFSGIKEFIDCHKKNKIDIWKELLALEEKI